MIGSTLAWVGSPGTLDEPDGRWVEPLPDGVGPPAGRETQTDRGPFDGLARRHRTPTGRQASTPLVGEDNSVGIVGIAPDSEAAQVMKTMMALA